jgi:AcrR family transcriptional regulator
VPDTSEPDGFRDRLLHGLSRSIAERGYRATTITDIVGHASASRRTFYKVFSTKDDCLVDLIRMVNDELAQQLTEAVDPHVDWRTQVAQAIETYFAHVAAQPAVHLCSIREFPSLGPIAEEVIRKSSDAFVDLIHDLSDNEEFRRSALGPAPRHLALIIQGGLNELTADLIETGGDLRLGAEIATATTTALLATDFASRGNPPGRKAR